MALKETRVEEMERVKREEAAERRTLEARVSAEEAGRAFPRGNVMVAGGEVAARSVQKSAEEEREEAAKREVERLAKRSPEHAEFDDTLKGLRTRLTDMQLRDGGKLTEALDKLESVSGHPKKK